MDEKEMDAYIGRCLKNWSAFQQPEQNGRQRLLRAAGIRTDVYATRLGWPLANVLKSILSMQSVGEPETDALFLTFTQSRLWSFHMTTSPRVAI